MSPTHQPGTDAAAAEVDADPPEDALSMLSGGVDLLDAIEPLWLLLREHHADLSPLWRAGLISSTFEVRKAGLIAKSVHAGGELLVLLALSEGEPCGYCVCTVTAAGVGEIDSIFVRSEFRGFGMGGGLMARAMGWLRERTQNRGGEIIVDVLACNDDALRLYARFGFHARTVRMKYVPTAAPMPVEPFALAAEPPLSPPPPPRRVLPADVDEPAPSEEPVESAEPTDAAPVLEYRTVRKRVEPDELPLSTKRGPRQVIPVEFDVVIANTQDQAAAASIEQQLQKEGIPVFRTHDGPSVDLTIELVVRAENRVRAQQIADAIFFRRRRIKSFPRQLPK